MTPILNAIPLRYKVRAGAVAISWLWCPTLQKVRSESGSASSPQSQSATTRCHIFYILQLPWLYEACHAADGFLQFPRDKSDSCGSSFRHTLPASARACRKQDRTESDPQRSRGCDV